MSKLIVTSLSAIVLALGVTGALAESATPGTAQDGTQVPPTVRTDGPAQGMPGAMATGQGMMGSGMMQGGPQGQPAGQNDRQAMPGGSPSRSMPACAALPTRLARTPWKGRPGR